MNYALMFLNMNDNTFPVISLKTISRDVDTFPVIALRCICSIHISAIDIAFQEVIIRFLYVPNHYGCLDLETYYYKTIEIFIDVN
jgi:hypothetical protein